MNRITSFVGEPRFLYARVVHVVVSVDTMQFNIAQSSFQNFPNMSILGVFSRKNDAQTCADSARALNRNVFIYESEYDKPQNIFQSSSYIN